MEGATGRLAGLSPDKRALLEALLQKKRAASAGAATIRPRNAGGGPWPLSFSQERLWLIDQIEPGTPAYNMPLALRLTGELASGLLARVFAEILRRHEALRTTFAVQDGHPVQVIVPPNPPELPLVDLAGLRAERDAQALRLAGEEAARPFDLQRGPLLRLCLVRLAAREHLLLVTLHHIISDGWSLGVLQREVGTLYAAFSAGRPSLLSELPVQYADFAVWQRSRMSGEALAGQLGWWKEELAGAPGEHALPLDRSRGPLQSREGASLLRTLPGALAEAVQELARREGATSFMLLLAAFQMLLHRLSGQEDVLVGTPVANRGRVETEGLIGFFVNTLVLRGRLGSRGLTFRGLLEATRETVLAAFERQDLPFERLVEELVPERNLAVAPLFQVFFSLQTASRARFSLPGLTLEALPVHSGAAQFDLSLDLLESGGELRASLEISHALFDVVTGQRMLEAFVHLLRGAVHAPERRTAEILLLDEAQRHQVLREWNDNGDLPKGCGSILPLFESWAALAPDAPAVSQGDRRLTYGELDLQAGRLARRLRRLGVGPETRVGVVAERAPELIVALLGILEAGGAYVPIDPAYPQERRAFMLADSGAVLLEEVEDDKDSKDGKDRRIPEAEQLAYVLYTSGSTGRPKGVMGSHGALARYVEAVRSVYGIGPGDRVLQFCSTSFDTSLEEIVACLACGAELVLRTDAMLGSVATFLESCGAQGVTVLSLPTAYWHEIAAKVETEGLSLPPGLRLVILGGERTLLSRVAAWRRSAPERPRLLNTYGVTESTIVSTATDLAVPSPAEARGEVSIGRAIRGTEILLLDREGLPVPMGTAGELLLGGALLARGYLGRPDLTAERFVPHPFAKEPGARLYRTGDLARALPDGQLEFAGRADRQIKVRGYRIEVEEIEARLLRHPEVESAVVVVREDRPGEKLIAAYLVPRSFPGPAPAALRVFVRETLPDYMTPSAYVPLAALPLTPNGKLDRGALPVPESALAVDESLAAPSDPIEELLAGIWAEVLGRDRVGVRDDFFALGGHSLLATQVVSRIRGVLNAGIALRQLFEAPTVAELARVVRAARQDAPQPPIERVARDRDLPLSFAQQRLWLIDQLEPGSPAYNIPSAVRLSGEVSPSRLERIFAEIVRRHEALRTTFAAHEGRPVQVIADPAPVPLPLVDLTGLAEDDRETRARELATEEARRPFDLQRGPLLRLALLRLAAREHVLLVTMHHIVSDGWSMGVLLRDIAALSAESPLPELPVQYADFAVWQRGWLQGEALEAQLASWKRRLAGAPHVLELPTDRTRPAVQTARGAVRPIDLPPDLSAALRRLCRQESATPFMALLAAWSVLLGRHAGQDDLLVGSPIAGRNRQEIEDLIGFFVNTLVLRADLSGSPSFRELLARVRSEALEAFSHQDLPFERLVEELVPERDLSHSPLFQVLFVLLTAPAGELSVPGLSLAPLAVASGVAKFDLTLTLGEAPSGISGGLEFNTDLFDASTAERLLARFAALLEGAAGEPGTPAHDLPLLLPAERLQLLEWNDTGAAPASGRCLHELFAAQAERTPEAVALVYKTERLTYAQLAHRAGGLARRLRELGVGPETRVAVCLERTTDLIAALLGVLAAGGAYVPIDPNYPAERRELMLEDSGAAVLITREGVPMEVLSTVETPRGASPVAVPAEPQGSRGIHGAAAGDAPRGVSTVDIPDAPLPRDSGVTPSNLAYLIYTSGSTGRPKGVAIAHRSAVALAGWAREMFSDEELAGMVAATSVCFDLSVFEIFVPLAFGGTIFLADNALALPELPARDEVRLLNTVPSAATELVRSGSLPASVRTVCLAGEPLPAALAAQLYATGTVERVLNLYGPSEDTTYSTGALIPRASNRPPAIGRPIRGTRAHVVDCRGALVPPGVAGELWLAGDGLARGYLGRPELTAERFTPDPFDGPGGRVYRTGDLVRFRPHGELEFLGRIDHQVKVRGFRIELGEIEAVLRSHSSVRDCIVLARENRLIAYVVGVDAAGLRAFLGRRLPEYMVPAAFALLDALPLSPNGKIDRKALPDPQGSHAPSAAPSDPVEELIAGIWAEVLGIDRVGVHESFFALGGHSLLATQVISRLRGALGVELPLRQLFETPTVADLARALRTAGGAPAPPPLMPASRDRDLPLSFAQQRLWLLDQIEPGSSAYNIPLALRLEGELSPGLLEYVFAEIARRHEALRTTFTARFTPTGGEPVQVIAAEPRIALPVVDLCGLPGGTEEARALAVAEARRPFDLEAGPLLRLLLVRLSAREHLLLATLHHIIADGWSLGVLLREVGALHAAFSQGAPSPLPELPVQYADFAVWQRRWLRGEVLEAQLDFWKRQLAGAPRVLDLPLDRPRPETPASQGARLPLALSSALSAEVQGLCRREGLTPFMALLAAWAVVLGRQAGQADILIGSPVAGRNRQEVEGLIGFFVNTLVLRSDLSGSPSFSELLGRVRRTALDAFTHQDLPFERIVEEVVTERDLAVAPLVQVLFTFQNAPLGNAAVPGLVISPVEVDAGAAKFDLALTLGEGPSGFAGSLEYDSGLFEEATAERLLAALAALLEGTVRDPGRSLGGLPLLPPAGRLQLVSTPAREPHIGPRDGLELEIARLFEEVLGVRGVGVRDDFFALGGHSLLAARLTFSLRQRLGRSFPLAAVLRHPTVEGLAALLRTDGEPPPRGPLVELAAGSGRPLFLIHPVGGEVLSYVHLARSLSSERSVYGLQRPDGARAEAIEEMAAGYLQAMRQVQPEGPYTLGGWSMGGVVAFEMARQLETRGESADTVVLIDSFAPGAVPEEPLSGGALAAAFAYDMARLLGIDLAGAPAGLAELDEDEALRQLAGQAQAAGLLPPGLDLPELQRRFATFAANARALERYAGGPCAAPILLVRASGRPAPQDLGWTRFAQNPIELHETPGDHYTLLHTSHVGTLASVLRERLA